MAVFPSADNAADEPCPAFVAAPVPTNLLPCWVQIPPLRVKTHAAPAPELSSNPPTIAVLPSPDSATEKPCRAGPTARVPTSLLLVQARPLRVKTHAAPAPELSPGPPMVAVLPSADNATEKPCWAAPTAPVPTSFGPCCVNCASAISDEKNSVAENRTDARNSLGD